MVIEFTRLMRAMLHISSKRDIHYYDTDNPIEKADLWEFSGAAISAMLAMGITPAMISERLRGLEEGRKIA